VNFKKRIGFIIWIASNIAWIAVNIISVQSNLPQVVMYLVYIGLNTHGFIIWKKSKKKGPDEKTFNQEMTRRQKNLTAE